MSADASIRVLALDGIPEIREGDDLGHFIGNAIQRTAGALPLTARGRPRRDPEDRVEGRGRRRRPDDRRSAAARPSSSRKMYDRDPRQVEVVLREARRVVRMENGVLITETAHGFVCANGGIDASNVGPASGSVVTLLPVDPDRSAAGIRAAIRARFGVDVPVVMSDSFGRPWRWGIIDIAIGVSGLLPLEDLRGTPDANGRIMKSTVRAVADELASAAELALGKTAGRPVALVRGAAFTRGEASIRDALIPAENDLFR